jgi:hypothetical protein
MSKTKPPPHPFGRWSFSLLGGSELEEDDVSYTLTCPASQLGFETMFRFEIIAGPEKMIYVSLAQVRTKDPFKQLAHKQEQAKARGAIVNTGSLMAASARAQNKKKAAVRPPSQVWLKL